MLKKVASCLLVALLLAVMQGGFLQPAHAEGVVIVPYYTYLSLIGADLYPQGSRAACSGFATASTSNTKTKVAVSPQRRVSGGSTWSSITTWTDTANGQSLAYAEGAITMQTGYDYRVKVVGTITDAYGNVIEQITKYTSVTSY